MAVNDKAISELTSLSPQFLRSVHLERDFHAKDTADGYLITRSSRIALSALARGIADPSYRAQLISGPYGAGKSALAMYFARLLDKDKACYNGFRQKQLGCLGEIGVELIPRDQQGYLSILATGTRESLSECLINSVKHSLKASGHQDLVRKLFKENIPSNSYNTRQIVQLFEDLAKLAVAKGALGVIVIIDELGKLLEHAALQPEDSDLHLLQEMAEAASRSHEHPFWFITILQQDFSYYASRLGKRHQREWSKVQQRFFDVPCTLDDTDAFQLMAAALNSSANPLTGRNSHIRRVAKACAKLAPKGSGTDFITWCTSSYPIHPTSLVVIPGLFRRYGQNERSLFSFLSANEAFSLHEWSINHRFREDDPPFIRIPQLFDYTSYTLIGGRPNPYSVRAWAEVEDALSRLGEASQIEIDVLKTIGLLGLLGDASPLSASKEMLRLALESPGFSNEQIDNAVKSLETKKLIVFRRFRNAYRLWEGSDIDIGDRLSEAYQSLPLQSASLSVARDLCPSVPVVARRHSFHTGMLRFFSIVPSSKDALQITSPIKSDYDGCVVQCLVGTDEEAKIVASVAKQLKDPSIIMIIGKESDELAESAKDVAALDWVKKTTPSLASDRVARQELSERRLEAEIAFRSEWSHIFEPGQTTFKCYWSGKEYLGLTKRAFASLLSEACDATFPYSPVVKNELINRRTLSSAGAGARHNLMEAMISNPEIPGLGITGYPPERSIYESLLIQSGIHRETQNKKWSFGRPKESDPGLVKAWEYIIGNIGSEELKPKSVADLFKEMSSPPYGLANGFLPILLCALLLSRSSTVAIYEDSIFIPDLSIAVMDRLVRRPEHFSVLSFSLDGERSTVVSRFARGFGVDNGVLPVVRSLYTRIHSLPQYTLTSKNMSAEAIAVRDAILKAKSPERLLFVDLPISLNCEPFDLEPNASLNADKVEQFFKSLNRAFSELLNCYPALLKRIEKGMLSMFDIPSDTDEWRTRVSARASNLHNSVVDSRLRSVLLRARDTQLGEEEYLESVGAGITDQTPNRWSKIDEDNFARLVPELASKMRIVESTQSLNSILERDEDGYLITMNDRRGEILHRVIRYSLLEQQQIQRIASLLEQQSDIKADRRILLAALIESARRIMMNEEENKK